MRSKQMEPQDIVLYRNSCRRCAICNKEIVAKSSKEVKYKTRGHEVLIKICKRHKG